MYGFRHACALALALAADELGIRDRLRPILERLPERSWVEAAQAALAGDFVRAAEISAASGAPAEEAELRLRAAEALVQAGRRADAEVELQKALAFYRSVGAKRYVRRGEALLAATA